MFICFDMGSRESTICLSNSEGLCVEEVSLGHQKQSENLLPALDALMARHQKSFSQIEGFLWGTGPGSFTGLRVGLATLKGLAITVAKPIISLSNHEVRALQWKKNNPHGTLCVLTRGSTQWLSKSVYRIENETLILVEEKPILVNTFVPDPNTTVLNEENFPLRARYLGECLQESTTKKSETLLEISSLTPNYGIPTTFDGV